MKAKYTILTALVIATALFSACAPPAKRIENAELENNIRMWRDLGVKNYNYRIHKLTFGNESWRLMAVQVRNGSPVSKEPIGEPGPTTLTDNFEGFDTVEKAFATIQEAYNKDLRVKVSYDKEFNYPAKIIINTNPAATDHTYIIELLNFEALR